MIRRQCKLAIDYFGVDKNLNVAGMLIPIAPDLGFQRFEGLRFRGMDAATKLIDESGCQAAWWLPRKAIESDLLIEYFFSIQVEGAGRERRQVDFNESNDKKRFKIGEVSEWTKSLGYSLANLNLKNIDLCDKDKIAKEIVDYIKSKFDYVSFDSDGDLPDLSCSLVTGNCLDINNALMGMLSEAGVRHSYFAGAYIPPGMSVATYGWHCWIASLTGDQIRYWDIAHHIRSDIGDIQPTLNPAFGTRLALSQGSKFTFNINGNEYYVKKFPLPTLLFLDGSFGQEVCFSQEDERRFPRVTYEEIGA